MFMARYCPKCGKPDTDAPFHGELCMECSKATIGELPNVQVIVCSKCGEVLDKGRKKKETTVQEEATRLLKLKGTSPVYAEDMTSVEYDTPTGRIKRDLLLLVRKEQCVVCARSNSQYFEAIIQVRGDDRLKVERMVEILTKRVESRSFIPKIEELKEGIDIYCGSRNEAIASLNAQKLGFQRTEKLAGEKNGKRLYRTTLLVRL
ncbi:MAG: NMD3-related protein [Candidatus Micrarchaeia archaeon]|jgi:NMD protein affecting ribosome stability and mRNA decay